jgi:hypothetical protein
MSTDYATAVTRLQNRVRQVGDLSLEQDEAIYLLGLCQQVANIALRSYVGSESFSTLKEKLWYSFADDLTNALDIISMVESDRELFQCVSLSDFSAYESDWFRNITGTRFEAWHQVSRDYFVIYPAKAAASSLTVKYVKTTPIYSDYSSYSGEDLLLPDKDIEVVIKLAELVSLTRARQTGLLEMTMKQAIDLFGARNVSIKSKHP